MSKVVKMIMVSADNNNKYYDMNENADGTWTATWGRVGNGGQTQNYSARDWDVKYREKVRKGYTDITGLLSAETLNEEEEKIDVPNCSPEVVALVEFLQSCARGTIRKNYTVSVADVTEKQIDAAQEKVNELTTFMQPTIAPSAAKTINELLLSLYTTIPRKMSNTKLYLLSDNDDVPARLTRFITNEQDLLDTLRGQVKTTSVAKTPSSKIINLSDFKLDIVPATQEERQKILKETDFKLTPSHKVFSVNNGFTKDRMVKEPTTLLFHGSRNENFWSILITGLKIRPSNAVYTGSMFGSAIYGANKAQKSIGYTSLSGSYWANGDGKKAYLAIFEFALGKQWNVLEKSRWDSWMGRLDETTCTTKGYNSVFAKGGADLRNDEYMIYNENRCSIKYLIELTV